MRWRFLCCVYLWAVLGACGTMAERACAQTTPGGRHDCRATDVANPEKGWAAEEFGTENEIVIPSLEDGIQFQPSSTAPWKVALRHPGESGNSFVPGGLRECIQFWDTVVLKEHPLRDRILTWLRHGVTVYEFLLDDAKGSEIDSPFNESSFPGEIYPNRIPETFTAFVNTEVHDLHLRGCIVPWKQVRAPDSPLRPRILQTRSIEPTKPRLIYDARPLNKHCKHVPFTMDTVGTVAQSGWRGCYQGSLDDTEGFHHVTLHPASWELFGFVWAGVDYVWTTLPFGFSASPYLYHTLSEARAQYIRSKGIPALVFIDDAWICTARNACNGSDRQQWLSAAHALRFAASVSYLCGYYLSRRKCEMVPVRELRYLGIIFDSQRAVFRVPADKLVKLRSLILDVFRDQRVTAPTLEKIVGEMLKYAGSSATSSAVDALHVQSAITSSAFA